MRRRAMRRGTWQTPPRCDSWAQYYVFMIPIRRVQLMVHPVQDRLMYVSASVTQRVDAVLCCAVLDTVDLRCC